MAFRYKRCRPGLKDKRDAAAFEHASGGVAPLQNMAQAGQCDLLYFDESGFSPNRLQYGWAPIGHSRCAEAGAHRQRVNVLGAPGHDGKLLWTVKEQRTVRDDVIVVFDSANIHRGEAMHGSCQQRRRQWQRRVLYQSRTEPHRNPVQTSQVLLAQVRSPDRRRTGRRG